MDVRVILQHWDVSAPSDKKAALKKQLIHHINELLLHDFEKLVHLLYAVDVSEQKLKAELAAQPTCDAAELIATLLIKRQEEKLAARHAFPPAKEDIAEDERW